MDNTDDDFRTYNDDSVHNGWVDFTYGQNTGEFSNQFSNDEDFDDDYHEDDDDLDDEC